MFENEALNLSLNSNGQRLSNIISGNCAVSARAAEHVQVRPLKKEDRCLFVDFFETLSSESKYLRFFTRLKSLPPQLLECLINIDWERDAAFVAIQKEQDKNSIIGTAHLMRGYTNNIAEFSILVSKPLYGLGIGAKLLEYSIYFAQENKMDLLWGRSLLSNTGMIAFCKRLGFTIRKSIYGKEYELAVNIDSLDEKRLRNPVRTILKH